MHHFDNKIDFYITNVCNLTCNHCNRFNNHNFKGWQNWKDYADIYEQWGKLIKLRAVTIMGGEPFLNPSLSEWVEGINRIFQIDVQILTNGTRFRNPPANLYETLLSFSNSAYGAKNHIGVSIHRNDKAEETIEDIRNFLGPDVKIFSKKDSNNVWGSDWHFKDRNGIIVNAHLVSTFNESSVIPLPPGGNGKPRFTLHKSDPDLAHRKCSFVHFKSYHFIRGALYKCAPAALLKQFDEQNPFEINEDQRDKIYNGYTPLTVENFDTHLETWLETAKNPIPQCTLCPENYKKHKIMPVIKGSKK